MTALFLIIWFYLYIGLNFAMVSTTLALFPKLNWFVQTLIWPVLALVHFGSLLYFFLTVKVKE